ncbi:MAG: hypothetical protein IJY16_00900 [Clostridia bacterium]|nr:hypothetical protein [Clostridia bacterium]
MIMKKIKIGIVCVLAGLLLLLVSCKQEVPERPAVTKVENGYITAEGVEYKYRLVLIGSPRGETGKVELVVYTNDNSLTFEDVETAMFSADYDTSAQFNNYYIESSLVLQ